MYIRLYTLYVHMNMYVCTEKKLRSLLCRESRMKMFVIPKINVFLLRERDCKKSEGYSIFVYFQKL